jgi:eukaryotic-like serine/threonine-protein kinase
MPRSLSCPQGHQWEASDADTGDSTACPICGVGIATLKPDQNDAATVLQLQAEPLPIRQVPLDQAPPELPGFEILGELGRGGMGIVYRARQRKDNAIVAIKVIRKDRLQHEEAVRRFRREAQAAARLSHPNIVHVFDFDRAGDTHFLVMEYVDGVTLEKYVDEHGPLSIAQACEFMRQAALGLQHAHEQALVHRDIKPSNLMMTRRPTAQDYTIKLLDMGVARVSQLTGHAVSESLSTLTQGGAVIGTADYVAPEQLEDPHGADIRADLYSLGCTFYFLLTGQGPLPGGSLIQKLDKQRWQEPTPLATMRGDIKPGLARLVDKLMAKNPVERFQTPGELADALALVKQHNYDDPPAPRIEFIEKRRLTGHVDAVLSVRFAPDGKHLASGGKDGIVIYWDAATGQIVRRFAKHPQDVRAIAFSPTHDLIATASGLTVRLFDIRGQEIRRLSGHSGSVKCVAFSRDGKRLVTGSDDKSIRVWDAASGREVLRLGRHTAGINALTFVADTTQIASASKDQTVRVWDLRSGLETHCFEASAGAVLDVAVSADGKRIASGHFDTSIRLWDLEADRELGELTGHKQMVSALAFAPKVGYLVSAGQDHTLRLWNLATLTEVACASYHDAAINAISISPDGTRIVTAGADKLLVVSSLPH